MVIVQDDVEPKDLDDEARKEIEEQAIIYRKTINRPLTDIHLKVNESAKELALSQPKLVRKRGELLEKARKKVADDGYCFKKGKSRSKVYGGKNADVSEPKRVKLDQRMREERIKEVEEEIADITSHISFKEKCRDQAEKTHNYKVCDMVTQEILESKCKKRELDKELKLLLLKDKRSRRRTERLRQSSEERSRSATPFPLSPPPIHSPTSPVNLSSE